MGSSSMARGSKTGCAIANTVTDRKSKAKESKRMKQIFRGKSFSFSGDFGENWGHEKMAGWIKPHGGRYEREVSDDTTHLICTVEHFKQKTKQVKKAWTLGKQCHIVVKDWLEDCLIGHVSQKRCRAEKWYTLGRVLKRVDDGLKKQKEYRLRFENGVRAGFELVDNNYNHVYCDQTGFEYKVVCTRLNSSGKVKSEKYTIYLFESNAMPCHYMAGAKLTSPGRHASCWRTECHPKTFWAAFRDFTGWFRNVTGIEWDDRLDGVPQDPERFRYTPPTLGRPVGALPFGKKPPSWEDVDAKSDGDEGLVYDTDSEVEDEYGEEDTNGGRGERQASVISISSGPVSETAN